MKPADSRGARRTRPWLWLILGVLGASALVAGGWALAMAFVSPAQRDAAASAPSPKPIFAPVQQGDLLDVRTVPGSVMSEVDVQLMLAESPDDPRSIVTETPFTPGDTVSAGDIVVRINGRPVFLLSSPFPFYRDLGVGDEGPDVLALQNNLIHLGYLSNADGRFGPATATAVARLYSRVDAVAPTRTSGAGPGPAPEVSDITTPASPYLPMWAMLGMPSLPARIAQVPTVGSSVTGDTTVRLVASQIVIRVALPHDLQGRLETGASVEFSIGGGPSINGTIASIGLAQPESGSESPAETATAAAEQVDVVPADASALDPHLEGGSATVSFLVETLATDALIVPTVSVAQRGTDGAVVLKQAADGSLIEVAVRVVGTLRGQSAITPVEPGTLRPRDLVKVG